VSGSALGERRALERSRALRELAAIGRRVLLRRDAPDLAHLSFYDELSVGPVQRDEALALHALVRVLRPRTVMELGFLRGDSAFNFLRALDADARLYSFDVDPACEAVARERFAGDSRLVFRLRSQAELTAGDVDGRPVDFVFIDAAHELELNKATFERLIPLLAPGAVVAVHDTGTIGRDHIPTDNWTHGAPGLWVDGGFEHQPGERAFVNWLLQVHPEFAQLHLHTHRTPRQGITLLQRSGPLPRPDGAGG
jgi:predicted O-methyltransferase YrrM